MFLKPAHKSQIIRLCRNFKNFLIFVNIIFYEKENNKLQRREINHSNINLLFDWLLHREIIS